MWNVLAGFAAGAAPGVIDLFTGASKKRKAAKDAQKKAYDQMIGELNVDIGKSVIDSLPFKTALSALDENYGRQDQANTRTLAAAGVGSEGMLGSKARLNESFNRGVIAALADAENVRAGKLAQRNNLMLQKYGLDVQDADNTMALQGQMAQGITSVIPYLLDPKKQTT
jgi:hypothetical protein